LIHATSSANGPGFFSASRKPTDVTLRGSSGPEVQLVLTPVAAHAGHERIACLQAEGPGPGSHRGEAAVVLERGVP
jgi:hypothetical protein